LTRNGRQHGRLAAAGFAVLLLLTLTACGSGGGQVSASASASATANLAADVTHLTACLRGHGVTIAPPPGGQLVSTANAKAIRSTLRSLPTAKRQSVVASCQQFISVLRQIRAQLRK
jgi:hypothetical protein